MREYIDVQQLRWLVIWAGLFVGTSILVQTRVLATTDQTIMGVIADSRAESQSNVWNWIFRLGYAQVDVLIAVAWATVLLVRRRSLVVAIPPLLIFATIVAQVILRNVVAQPGLDRAYELRREYSAEPVGNILDNVDALARETVMAATSLPQPINSTVGASLWTYPSGHACRVLFLALLAIHAIRKSSGRWAWLGSGWSFRSFAFLAGFVSILVGYSTMFFGYHWPSDLLGGYLLGLVVYQVAVGPSWESILGIFRRSAGHG
ncbi:MAG: phosphatase PAP2 family protein [Dehalococcoidia bacterium]|nr:phosphatase PAP2 family protein [Dehalococcoidia bacterium]